MRAFDLASQLPWAMTEPALRTVLEIAAREGEGAEAVATRLGRPLDNARQVTVRDGVAVIPVLGPIFRRANLFTEVSGATSVEVLARDIATALASADVRALVLEIDSPGGEAAGINELAQMLFAARGRKPLVAYADGLAASAAYWLASACDEIVCDATAGLGSVGVVMAVPDPAKRTAREVEIVASRSPNKRPDVGTERGRAQLQALVDATADVFIAAVARNRGLAEATIVDDWGGGAVLIGQAAVTAGMADRLGSFEGVVTELVSGTWRRPGAPAPGADDGRRAGGPADSGMARGGGTMATLKERVMAWWLDDRQAPAEPAGAGARDAGAFSSSADPGVAAVPGGGTGVVAATEGAPATRSMETGVLAPDPEMERLPPDPEMERLRAEVARLKAERVEREAAAFAEGAVGAGKAYPAERGLLAGLFARALLDDEAGAATLALGDGQSGGRAAALRALIGTRPGHGLTEEQLDPRQEATAEALGNRATTPAAGQAAPLGAAKVEELLGATTLGQAILAERRAAKASGK